jgi:hypothetical protein
MEERAKAVKSQVIETKAFDKFQTLLDTYQENSFYEKLMKELVLFYYKGENTLFNTLCSFSGRKNFILNICREVIETDATEYINTGKRGKLAQDIYNRLNKHEKII